MKKGTGLVLLSAFLWGTTFPATRYGLEEGQMGPYQFLYFRFALATLILLVFAAARRRIDFRTFADPWILGLGLLNALGYLLQYVAQERTTASKTALMVNVNVLITAILAYYLLKERIARSTGWGAVVGVLGVFLLTSNGDLSVLRFSNQEFLGDLLAFGTGVCWTIYILAMKNYFTKRPDADVIAITVVLFVVTTVVLFPIAWATDGLEYAGTAGGLLAVLYLATFPTSFALWAYQEGLKSTSAAISSVLLLFETVVAVVISVAFLSERLSGWTAVGAVLILTATYLASRSPSGIEPGQAAPEAVAPTEQERARATPAPEKDTV